MRALRIGKGIAILRVEPVAGENALMLRVRGAPAAALLSISATARRVFDLAADPGPIAATLGRDRDLAALLRRRPGLRIPGDWDAFECAVRSIAGAAATARIARDLGDAIPSNAEGLTHLFPGPRRLPARASPASGAHVPGCCACSREMRRTARSISTDRSTRSSRRSPRSAASGLQQTVALFALGEPDALPAASLAARAEAWRPWRSYGYIALTK